jgi:hypothetical protein
MSAKTVPYHPVQRPCSRDDRPRRRKRGGVGTSCELAELFANNDTRRLDFAMTQPDLLQFEVIRTIAASLISVAIFLLWLVAVSR